MQRETSILEINLLFVCDITCSLKGIFVRNRLVFLLTCTYSLRALFGCPRSISRGSSTLFKRRVELRRRTTIHGGFLITRRMVSGFRSRLSSKTGILIERRQKVAAVARGEGALVSPLPQLFYPPVLLPAIFHGAKKIFTL